MTDPVPPRPASAFRLNLEQQKTRAKELLRSARAGDAAASSRLAAVVPQRGAWKLADAQHAIARELRFESWARLKAHIGALEGQRAAIEARAAAPDADLHTLHVRCGSDIQLTLAQAGFVGEFLEHAIPYCQGPVTLGPERHELMARFLVEAYPDARGGLLYERELEGLIEGERRLERVGGEFERIVLWMEHDSWDQLVLARVLACFARCARPRVLELVSAREFPGGQRFLGLGQLPPEALRLLWSTRAAVTETQLALGSAVWSALSCDDPTGLAGIARSGTPALPIMAPALLRHLRELPSIENGLSLTEQLILEILAEGSRTLNRVFFLMQTQREPLPWITDLGLLHVVDDLLRAAAPVLVREPAAPGARAFAQRLTITDLGRAVLRGARDWHSLEPPARWVGGVHVQPRASGWRWNERQREPQRTPGR